MKIKINNEADKHAIATLASLQNPRSLTAVIASYAEAFCPDDEDFEAIIKKSVLTNTYQGNPSLLAIHTLAKAEGFLDSSGHRTPNAPEHVSIKLLRREKPAGARYTQAQPSLKRVIKNFLELNEPKFKRLSIPLGGIPAFYASHSEQLKYQIKQETGTPIKIIKLKTKWLIARK